MEKIYNKDQYRIIRVENVQYVASNNQFNQKAANQPNLKKDKESIEVPINLYPKETQQLQQQKQVKLVLPTQRLNSNNNASQSNQIVSFRQEQINKQQLIEDSNKINNLTRQSTRSTLENDQKKITIKFNNKNTNLEDVPKIFKDETNVIKSIIIEKVQQKVLNKQDFQIGKLLGQGQFAKVYLARHKDTKLLTALKLIDKKRINQLKMNLQIEREIKINSFLYHPNILQCYGVFGDDNFIYLILEYCCDGNLYNLMMAQTNQRFLEIDAAYYIRQVLEAFKYMQNQSIIHRDLKPENLLLSQGVIKLSDFGVAIHINPDEQRQTFCGTLDYVSPEVIEGKPYDSQIDLWGLGVLAYELCSGQTPFKGQTNVQQCFSILQVNFSMPQYFSQDLKDFIKKLLVKNPSQRLSIEEIINHQWITNNLQKKKKQWDESITKIVQNLLQE